MKLIKDLAISFSLILAYVVAFTLLLTIMNYFNWIGAKTLSILKIGIAILGVLLGGVHIGRKSKQKGWLEGLKLGLVFLVFIILFNYLGLSNKPEVKNILYYIIMIVSCIFGSMIGISTKKNS